MQKSVWRIAKGTPQPFGTSLLEDGVNFSLYVRDVLEVKLCLFSYDTDQQIAELFLDPNVHKTGDVWHVCVFDLPKRVSYIYKIVRKGKDLSFILDPYAKGVDTPDKWASKREYQPKGLVIAQNDFDWEGDQPPGIDPKDLIIYEMHVRGFTQDVSSKVTHPGTFLGVLEKIDYLKELGVNAVKLMPIQEFNEKEYRKYNPETGKQLCNYWGYSTVQFFSPMNRYASDKGFAASLHAFQTMVKALHAEGIEVFLDIVFNHTAEGGESGPIYSFKALDCETYYMRDKGKFLNFTGCGNTVNCNHPIVRDFIRNCLRYWVTEMHVDGFRFDLAGVFMRGEKGAVLANPPLLEELSEDPVLSRVKLIAEPWDAGGVYALGGFYPQKERWSEWNGAYRDCLRHFIKGDNGWKRAFANALCGSDTFFSSRSPKAGINFITAHDGFTLSDLVSYNTKHNFANAEGNRDGNSNTLSWNCGVEGATEDPEVMALRYRQMCNFHLALMLSQGVPMLLMGNEYGHTREGNNNAWCQDNYLNWFLWDRIEKNEAFFRFYKKMIHFRKTHPILRLGRFIKKEDIDWHGLQPFSVDWDSDISLLAFTLKDFENDYFLYAAFNASHMPLSLQLPAPKKKSKWKFIVNTFQKPPEEFFEEEKAPLVSQDTFVIDPYSALLLKS